MSELKISEAGSRRRHGGMIAHTPSRVGNAISRSRDSNQIAGDPLCP